MRDRRGRRSRSRTSQGSADVEGHNRTGHNFMGHNYMDHGYVGRNYIGHTYIGHIYICHNCIGHNHIGYNCIGHKRQLFLDVDGVLGPAKAQPMWEAAMRQLKRITDVRASWPYACHNYISASPRACPLRGYGRAGTQKGGHFGYRHAHTRAMDMPSATSE